MKRLTLLFAILLVATPARAQGPRAVDYVLRVDSGDFSVFHVEMHIHNSPAAFTLASAAHPEYDDKYWRYVENLRVTDAGGRVSTITRLDSVRWRVRTRPGEVLVRYRVRPPAAPPLRAPWRSFLTPSGGLAGGPHSFLYVLGAESVRARVTLKLPRGWGSVTGMSVTGNPHIYTTPSIDRLMDSPIVIGHLSSWRFAVRGVPHRVAYLRSPATVAFDSVAFVAGVERYTRQVVAMFGSMPYSDYVFLFEDDAFGGGLEHLNSVTLGAPSAELAKNPHEYVTDIAHEFFHTWNLMQIRPVEYRRVDYRTQPPVAGLWFSEGLTMFYADLLLRRAGLPADSTRTAHLENIIRSYVSNAGNSRFSAEQVSKVAYNSEPGVLGDYSPSTHLQGEVIGAMLDIVVRDASNGAKSMDDVMRLMLKRFSHRGFNGYHVERAVSDVCACRIHDFFESYVRGSGAIDFDRYLALLGMHATISRAPALKPDGKPAPDMRIRGLEVAQDTSLRLMLWNPASIWVRAGLHMGDRIVSMNGKPIRTWSEMRSLLGPLGIGDTVRFEVLQPTGPFVTTVAVTGYETPVVRIEAILGASSRQKRLGAAWRAGR